MDDKFFRKPAEVLLRIRPEDTFTSIGKKADTTFSYLVIMINYLKERELIFVIKEGRENKVYLTDRGVEVQKLLSQLNKTLNTTKNI